MTPPTLTDHIDTLCRDLGIHGTPVAFTHNPFKVRLCSVDEVEVLADHAGTGVEEIESGVYGAVATIAGQRVAFVSPVPKVVVRR